MNWKFVLSSLTLASAAIYAYAGGHGCGGHGSHGGHGGHSGGHGGHHSHYGGGSYSEARYTPPYDGRWDKMGGRLALNITPSRMPDPQGGMVPVGFEYFVNKNFSIGGSYYFPLYGMLLGGGTEGGMDYVQLQRDHRYSGELRYYFGEGNSARAFTGIEGYYRNTQEGIDSGGYVQNGAMYSYGHATVTKESTGVGVLIGGDFYLGRGVMFELYTGVGLRTHTTWQEDIIRPRADGPDTCSCTTRPDDNIIGTHENVYIPFGFKFSYTFGQTQRRQYGRLAKSSSSKSARDRLAKSRRKASQV